MNAYDVIFTGRTARGASRQRIEEHLLQLLKCSAEQISPFFSGGTLVVKKGLPRERAETFASALTRAGAVCTIRKTGQTKARADSPGQAVERPVKVVSPVIRRSQLLFAPLTCPILTSAEGGINVNRKDKTFVPFEDIALLAVTYDSGQGVSTLRLLMFIHPKKRPLIVDAAKVSFATFPDVSGEGLSSSTRRFVTFLLEKNPHIVIDEDTSAFLENGQPKDTGRDVIALATALAAEVPQKECSQTLAGSEYRYKSPELQRQYELLKINRRQARRASFLGIFLGLFLVIFFFRKAYRCWKGYG